MSVPSYSTVTGWPFWTSPALRLTLPAPLSFLIVLAPSPSMLSDAEPAFVKLARKLYRSPVT
jgi:hypothetical protein